MDETGNGIEEKWMRKEREEKDGKWMRQGREGKVKEKKIRKV